MNAMHESTGPRAGQGRPEEAPPYAQAPSYAPAPHFAPMAALRDPRAKSPALAAILSMMPGLGQIYVGYYQSGFVHAIVVATLITIIAAGVAEALTPMLGLFMAFFWLYNIIDAARRASLYNQVLAGNPAIDLPEGFRMPKTGGSILGGVSLVGFGFILLLHTRFGVPLDWLEEWWPVVPMLFGAYLLARAIQERRTQRPAGESDTQA
jgi:hypothetical protein